MNLLQTVVELLFVFTLVLRNKVYSSSYSECQNYTKFQQYLSTCGNKAKINCTDAKINKCKDLLKIDGILENCNIHNCSFCQNKNIICYQITIAKESYYFYYYIDVNSTKDDSKHKQKGGSTKPIHVMMIFLIVFLSIAIFLIIAKKNGYFPIFEKLDVNEKVIYLKRRISGRNNKEIIMNSYEDLTDSNVNLSENAAGNQSNVQIINEFKRLCAKSKIQEETYNLTVHDGGLPENKDKNRFVNILPFDQSRVKLQRSVYESDYINANYIPFFNNPNASEYIAAQGPLINTVSDFWWMVWEQNVSVIVMLTKVFENGRIKCEQYWPSLLNEEEESDDNTDFSVLLTDEMEFRTYTIRKLKLTNKISTKWRNIIQLHMHTWDDYGIPNLEEFENSLHRFRELTSSDNSPPYVIHCSAGVGRTGTFITIDRIMKKVLSGKSFVNIYEEVLELRKHRSFMVQQKAQYIFIHKFIEYFLKKYHEKDQDCEIEENIYEI